MIKGKFIFRKSTWWIKMFEKNEKLVDQYSNNCYVARNDCFLVYTRSEYKRGVGESIQL